MEPAVAAQRRWGCWAFMAAVSLVLTGGFVWGVYQAPHSRWGDLTFVIATYFLIACCVVKLNHLLRDDPAAAAPEWRRVRFAVWIVSVTMAYTIELRIDQVIPDRWRWLKNAVWHLTNIGVWLAFYFFIWREDAGCLADGPLLEVSPEQSV